MAGLKKAPRWLDMMVINLFLADEHAVHIAIAVFLMFSSPNGTVIAEHSWWKKYKKMVAVFQT